jgi:glutamyl-tRNA reductase
MHLQLLGVNHQTAPLPLREALALDAPGVRDALGELRRDASIREAAILATCNRTELYVRTPEPQAAESAMNAYLARRAGAPERLEHHTYSRTDAEAARHLLRVAAGLDSMILGEHQILGQVRDAQTLARHAETLGPMMDRLWSTAIHAGKRARAETDIGTGAVSVASAAVSLAERVLGNLASRAVLVIGAGETGRLVARHFADRRPSRLVVANRTRERAATTAAAVGGEAVGLEELGSVLAAADVVVSATGAPGFVVAAAAVRAAMHARPQRPLVLVDIAVPRDIDPAAGALENAFLYPIDALQTLVDRSLARRLHEVPRVEAIVEDELTKLMTWTRGLRASPVVRELAEHFERVRAEEVRRSLKHFHPEEEAHIERLTKTLINRLLRAPIARLRLGDTAESRDDDRLDVVRDLFALDANSTKSEPDHGTR